MILLIGKSDLPPWAVVLFWVAVLIFFVRSTRSQERRRREEQQPHTFKDSVLLLLSGVTVAVLLMAEIIYAPAHTIVGSRAFGYSIVPGVGGALTFVFNRHRKRK